MLPRKFIKKHKLILSDNEVRLCKDAMDIMAKSIDVVHDETHVYRLLDYLDGFMATEEYGDVSGQVDLKALFIAILWHDTWRARRDPKNIFQAFPDMILEEIFSTREFLKAAKKSNLDEKIKQNSRYIIRKHTPLQVFPPKTIEARIMREIDNLDILSLDRLYLIEKKFVCDRPFELRYWRLAKFATRIFIEPQTDKFYTFDHFKEDFGRKKESFLKKVRWEIDRYKEALDFLRAGKELEFEQVRQDYISKNLTRPEKELVSNPF